MIYYKNTPIVRSRGISFASEGRILSPDEIERLVLERKITPINEIKYDKRGDRLCRPATWITYER